MTPVSSLFTLAGLAIDTSSLADPAAIVALQFLHGEPVLLVQPEDNSLEMYLFDTNDGVGRVLRERSGHSEPLTKARFYGEEDSHIILSGSQDRTFRLTSLHNDAQNMELSQKRVFFLSPPPHTLFC